MVQKQPQTVVEIRPQEGPQYSFLSSPADITIYGGAAGGGKTWGLLCDGARHIDNPQYRGAIFRREISQITVQGGLWDESSKIYPLLGAVQNSSSRTWTFESGATIRFEGCEHESDKYKFQGAQWAWLGFDELTHFTESQFWYLWSRCRSMSGVKPRVRATCNPDPFSWVKNLLEPWLSGRARSGELVWFVREEIGLTEVPEGTIGAISITFIPAKLSDNKKLMESDPQYKIKLDALPASERKALRDGSWNAVVSGEIFDPSWWKYIDQVPKITKKVRYWDNAATEVKPGKDPDWTVGVLMGLTESNQYVILDIDRFRLSPAQAEQRIKSCAARDGQSTMIAMEEEGGSSGKIVTSHFSRNVLAGYQFSGIKSTGDKQERAKPFSSAVENGNVLIPSGSTWAQAFVNECAAFPDPKVHDDQVDAASGAFSRLSSKREFKVFIGRTGTTGRDDESASEDEE